MRGFLIALLIVGAGGLAYANSFAGSFVFDDTFNILKNRDIKHLWPVEHWLYSRRPVVALSLAINYRLGAFRTWGYHLFNVGVHLLAGLVLFGVVRRTVVLIRSTSSTGAGRYLDGSGTGAGRYSGGPDVSDKADWFAGAAGLLWVVHPLATQSVSYIIQRGESLMGLFYLLTLYGMIRGAVSSHPRRWYGFSIVCCVLGMGSKAVMVTAPVVMVLYDWVFLAGREDGRARGSFGNLIRRRWLLHLGLASTWIVLVLCGVAGAILNPPANASATVGFAFKGVTPLDYALTQPEVILHYLRLALWPAGQCLDYGWTAVDGPSEAAMPGLVIVTLLAATVWALWRRHWLGFAGAWFFLILSPTSSFIPIRDLAFEHRMYLPLAAVIVVVLAGGWSLLRVGLVKSPPLEGHPKHRGARGGDSAFAGRRVVLAVLVVLAASALGLATHRRNALYRDPVLIWKDTIAKAPENPRPPNSLAWVYLEREQNAEAIREFRRAIAVDPDYAPAHANLAGVLLEEGDYRGSIAECQKALQLDPEGFGAEVYIRLATAHLLQGENAAAITAFRRALRIDPAGCGEHVYLNLGTALLNEGRIDEAMDAIGGALRLNAEYDMAYYSLGNARLAKGNIQGAIDAFREAVRVNPRYAEAYVRMGIALSRAHRPEQAIAAYQQAMKTISAETSSWVRIEARYEMGKTLLALGRKGEAAASFRAALHIDPRHAGARDGLRAAEPAP